MDCRNSTCSDEICFTPTMLETDCFDVPCEKRCYCQEGFKRINGDCVPRKNCYDYQSDECEDPNAFYNSCGSACGEPKCGEKLNDEELCTDNCVAGCNCNAGFIRYNGSCISGEECLYLMRNQ